MRLEPPLSPQAGEQRAQPEGRIGRGAVQIQRLTQPTDRGQFLFQLAPGEGRRQESEGAERRESPPYVRLPGEPPPVARALSPPVERRPRVADGEELPAGGDSRNLELPEDDRLKDSGLYGGAGFGGDEEDRLAQTIRANGFPHRFRREGVEELHVQAASPGKPGNERLRTERGPTHRHHDEALETPASSSSRSRRYSGSSLAAVSGRSTQPSRSSSLRAPVAPSRPGGARSVQGSATLSGKACSGRTDTSAPRTFQRLQVMVFAGVKFEETGLAETGVLPAPAAGIRLTIRVADFGAGGREPRERTN